MATFYVNEAAFELPEIGFVDRTVNVLEATTSDGEIGVFVHRQPLAPGATLRQIMTEQLEQERRSLAGHAIVFDREAEVDGVAAILVGTRWRGEQIMVYQELAFVALQEVWLLIGVNAPVEKSEIAGEVMAHVLATMKLRA
jgi:hypothetical protein